MSARARRRREPPGMAPPQAVVSLDCRRIERALARRSRYRYVKPRVEAEGTGWKIVSPNCSRNVDREGGDIAIAWFEPDGAGRWQLHARDHAAQAWTAQAAGLTLEAALLLVCVDPDRLYWP